MTNKPLSEMTPKEKKEGLFTEKQWIYKITNQLRSDSDKLHGKLFQHVYDEGKREERERVMGILKKEYPAITTWQCWQALKGEDNDKLWD